MDLNIFLYLIIILLLIIILYKIFDKCNSNIVEKFEKRKKNNNKCKKEIEEGKKIGIAIGKQNQFDEGKIEGIATCTNEKNALDDIIEKLKFQIETQNTTCDTKNDGLQTLLDDALEKIKYLNKNGTDTDRYTMPQVEVENDNGTDTDRYTMPPVEVENDTGTDTGKFITLMPSVEVENDNGTGTGLYTIPPVEVENDTDTDMETGMYTIPSIVDSIKPVVDWGINPVVRPIYNVYPATNIDNNSWVILRGRREKTERDSIIIIFEGKIIHWGRAESVIINWTDKTDKLSHTFKKGESYNIDKQKQQLHNKWFNNPESPQDWANKKTHQNLVNLITKDKDRVVISEKIKERLKNAQLNNEATFYKLKGYNTNDVKFTSRFS